MTPGRALEVAQSYFGKHPGALSIALRDIILAACREERHAALTEAAEEIIESHQPNCIGCAAIVMGLRDREEA